jgi:fatty acid desaturase
MPVAFTLSEQDVENFTQELMALRRATNERMNLDDFKHLKKIERWGKFCTAAGYSTAWIMPNPVSAFLMSQGNVTRWTTIAHHVVHKGYDKIDGVPERYTSTGFAKGLRRFLDWNDWILPQAWANEHNKLHHYNLGEAADPDQVELNFEWLRDSNLPMPVRYAIVGLFAMSWKPVYYAPNTLKHLRSTKNNVLGEERQSAALSQLPYGIHLIRLPVICGSNVYYLTLWLNLFLFLYCLYHLVLLPSLVCGLIPCWPKLLLIYTAFW